MHLPVGEIDAINMPTELYLTVQDGLNVMAGVFWTVAYVLYIRQSFRDESYGMPLLSLCANIAWELIYSVFYPPTFADQIVFFPWLVIDMVLVYATIKFGPKDWSHSPLVAQNLSSIIALGSVMMLALHWSFAQLFVGDYGQAAYWSGYACQAIVSWSAISQLISRGSTRGHSIGIWWCRFIGTLCVTLVFMWRIYHYPDSYYFVLNPMATCLFVAPYIAELAYPVVFYYIQKLERAEGQVTTNGSVNSHLRSAKNIKLF